ncbi:hypothetical protein B7435_07315 [Mycolicibacterium peregrinum]|uniref:DUF262 domain-containing protein n=1 Tax=Mycolicibacterium peregrinum TaxID=43304 RepID=UPI000B4BB893|nr:DUF262 domain-containing protein [Mycolicibacterium peregrinum]OWM07730.1 hypothetical protein B7435_07315 [Mycolicibacterium peregrinum]
MALRSYTMNPTARPIEFFLENTSSKPRFDFDQPYQRGVSWGRKRSQNLIKSIIAGVPIPAIVMNDRLGAEFSHPGYSQDRNWSYAIVDGKQRLAAIKGFTAGRLAVPAEWFTDGHTGETHFGDLPTAQQRFFMNSPLSVVEGCFSTLDEERELFDLINFGGLAQGETDEDLLSDADGTVKP